MYKPRLLSGLFAAVFSTSLYATSGDTTRPLANGPVLKEKTLNAETLIAKGIMPNSKRLDKSQQNFLSIKAIDKAAMPAYRYHLIDTLYRSKSHYILLLGQWYDYENKAWIASYAVPHRLIDFRQVFYDNAEGFLAVETAIKNNIIAITTYNEYAEGAAKKKTEKYKFTPAYKLQKIQ